MLRNRAIQISLARSKASTDEPAQTTVDVDQLKDAVQETVAFIAVTAGFLYLGKKVIDTTSQITIIAAQAKFNK